MAAPLLYIYTVFVKALQEIWRSSFDGWKNTEQTVCGSIPSNSATSDIMALSFYTPSRVHVPSPSFAG
jgi:hypothetical protein